MATIELLGKTTRVEAPFVMVQIGGYTFGRYSRKTEQVIDEQGFTHQVREQFPNMVQSISIRKVNGTVNTYSIVLDYAIKQGDDPNFIDKILSSVATSRRVIISYGDYSIPQFIYKEEEALITKVTSNLDIYKSCIRYVITAVSSATLLTAGQYSFPARRDKPSDIIKELLYNEKYGLLNVFSGMRNKQLVERLGLISTDDKSVKLDAKTNMSVLGYLDYLVASMTSVGDTPNSLTEQTKYIFSMFDDYSKVAYDTLDYNQLEEISGPYFRVIRVAKNIQETNNLSIYNIDVGYPAGNIVTNLTVNTDDAYTLLYNYSQEINQESYCYRINDKGEYEYIYNPVLSSSKDTYKTSQADKNWWTQVTAYPISVDITLKGLLRPAMLMTYVTLNVYFFGRKHNTSGVYIITKQQDNIDSGGYRTTLSLTRIKGDSEV